MEHDLGPISDLDLYPVTALDLTLDGQDASPHLLFQGVGGRDFRQVEAQDSSKRVPRSVARNHWLRVSTQRTSQGGV